MFPEKVVKMGLGIATNSGIKLRVVIVVVVAIAGNFVEREHLMDLE